MNAMHVGRSAAERDAVTDHLKSSGEDWTSGTPNFHRSTRADMLKKLEQVRDAVLLNTDAAPAEAEAAYEDSYTFVDQSFDFYDGTRTLGVELGRAFLVPMRSDRVRDACASESIPFFPLLDPHRFGVSSEVRMRTMYGLPPTVLDTYLGSDNPVETGALVLAPLYADMAADLWRDPADIGQAMYLSSVVHTVLADTVAFAHRRLGAKYLGLGAILPHPSLTDFGRKIRALPGAEAVTTTTGHGGTVAMLIETIRMVLRRQPTRFDGRIGILGGAGSIGWSTVLAVRAAFPELAVCAFDKRRDRMRSLADSADRIEIGCADSAAEILMSSRLVVSAITETLDLDDPAYADVDLSGTVWIDDSQPGSVARDQLETRGGTLLWVAGRDGSVNGFMTRDGYRTGGVAYNYGDGSGLYGHTTEFACGLEAAVVAASGDRANAVTGPVTFVDVQRISMLFERYGVDLAPLQSFGRPVELA